MVSRFAQRASRRSTNGHKKPDLITGLSSSLKAPDERLDNARLSEYRENNSKCLNGSGDAEPRASSFRRIAGANNRCRAAKSLLRTT